MELKFNKIPINFACSVLLIVPYGIEILFCCTFDNFPDSLLIVPYGIEMGIVKSVEGLTCTFNRTLWN